MFSLFVSFALSRSSHRRYFKREAEMLESNANGVGTCTTSAGVNIRSGPGTNYGKITAVPYKGTVTVTGSSGAWWKVTYGSTSGYAKAEYFSVPCKVSTSAGLNIRSGPGTGYSKITAMPNGASCTAIDLSNGWYKVQYGSTTGWASADYLTFGGSGSNDLLGEQRIEMLLATHIEKVDMANPEVAVLRHCQLCGFVDKRTFTPAARRDNNRVD